jgi:hypothetical protein
MKKITNIAAPSILAALCGVVFAAPANADVVRFNNLNATTVDADSIATYGPIADSFSTAEYAATLNQVSLKLSGAPDSGSMTVRLLSNLSNSPGSVLATIGTVNDSSLSSALSNYTLTLATPFNLAANTRYWIQLASNDSSANWAWSWDVSGTGVAGEYFSNANGVFANASEAPYQMQILTSAPEPSSFGILGLGLIGMVAIIRKTCAS